MTAAKLLKEVQVSEYLREQHGIERSVRTLQKLRWTGGGPEFRRIGLRGIGYEQAAIDTWARSIVSPPAKSTSDPALIRAADRPALAAAAA